MNNFDEWSQIITRLLKAEADLLTSVTKHEIDADSTRKAFIRSVLEPFLPSSYAIGTGRIIDSVGQSSDHIDIVIYRRDFPRLNLPGSSDVFLYESVLATIDVRTKLIRKTLFDALNSCASISKLNPGISTHILDNIATQNKMTLNDQNLYVHENPILTDRFNLIGRPPGFIYGFNGFQTSPHQLNESLKIWLERRREDSLDIDLKSFPAVIATQGCTGWRNAAPLSASSNHLFGIGVDAAPIRLIILQLLFQINRRLKVTQDGYGLRPSVDAYVNQMVQPDIQYTVGKAANEVKTASDTAVVKTPDATIAPVSNSQPAVSIPPPDTKPETKPDTVAKPASEPGSAFNSKPVFDSRSAFNSRPAYEAVPETKPDPDVESTAEAKIIPKPLLGAMYHPDPTLSEMPVPDASLMPDPEPETEAPKVEKEITPEPGSYIETVQMIALKPEPSAAEDSDSKPDPFQQTTRISAPISKPKKDPFDKTIPGLQNPLKSVH